MSLILTQAGLAAYAQADATGLKLQATHMAAGDGGGQVVAHTTDSTALVHETWRGGLQEITVAASGEVEFVAHVPITVGGWYIREVAIYADDVLLAVGAHPELWKPAPESPDKVELVITAPVKFANATTLSLTVDTTKVLASQEHVVVKIEEHNVAPDSHADLFAGLSDGLDAHAARTDNPHGVTAGQVGAAPNSHTHTPAQIGAAPEEHASNTDNPHATTVDQAVAAGPSLGHAVYEPYSAITDAETPAVDLAARNRFVWTLGADRTFPLLAPVEQGEWHFNVYPEGHTLTLDAGYAGLIVGEPDPAASMTRIALIHDGVSLTLYVDNRGV